MSTRIRSGRVTLNAVGGVVGTLKSARAASTVNVNLATLAAGTVVDGVVLATNDRLLLKDQAAPAENGLRIVPSTALPAGALRAPDLDADGDFIPSLTIAVSEGATQADTQWMLTTDGPITVGTTALTFIDVTGGTAPAASETVAGIAEIATQAETDAGTDDARIVTPLKLASTTVPGIDSDAVHDNVAGEIAAIAAKVTLVGADTILVEDSAAANAKKSSTVAGIRITESQITDLTHTDVDAVHDNVAGEISAVVEKVAPVAADLLLIEDSAAANAKKRVQIGNLPAPVVDADDVAKTANRTWAKGYVMVPGLQSVNGSVFTKVGAAVIDFDELPTVASQLVFHWDQVAVNAGTDCEVRLQDVTNAATLGSLVSIATTGLKSFALSSVPTGVARIEVQIREGTATGGTCDIEGGFLSVAGD